jgi:phosphate transport system substrate-binding protein
MAAFNLRAVRTFREQTGDTNTPLTLGSNSSAIEKFCNGEIDIAAVSREINQTTEAPLCSKNGITPQRILVAHEAAVVIANKALAVDCLTTSQLRQLWRKGSKITSYDQIAGGLPAAKVSLFGPTTSSDVFDLFTAAINRQSGNSRSDYRRFRYQQAPAFAAAIAADKSALGYFDYAAAADQLASNSVVSVDGGDGCIQPSLATIQNGSYSPLSRPLYYYFDLRQAASDTEKISDSAVARFIEVTLANAAMFAKANSLVPVTPDQITRERVRWLRETSRYEQITG